MHMHMHMYMCMHMHVHMHMCTHMWCGCGGRGVVCRHTQKGTHGASAALLEELPHRLLIALLAWILSPNAGPVPRDAGRGEDIPPGERGVSLVALAAHGGKNYCCAGRISLLSDFFGGWCLHFYTWRSLSPFQPNGECHQQCHAQNPP